MRRRRRDLLGRYIAPLPRFWGALVALPGFLILDGPVPRAIAAAIFAGLALAAGKRIRWGYFAVLVGSITFFHLLSPIGKVLWEIGPFSITQGALRNGLTRGAGLVGMVFLSVAAVRPELRLPGRFGGLLGRTFYHFERIIDGKSHLSRKDFFASLDRMLMERFNPRAIPGFDTAPAAEPGSGGEDTSDSVVLPAHHGWGWALCLALIPWVLWLFTRLGIL